MQSLFPVLQLSCQRTWTSRIQYLYSRPTVYFSYLSVRALTVKGQDRALQELDQPGLGL